MFKQFICLCLLLWATIFCALAQTSSYLRPAQWADSVLQTLSMDEKIAQLIMVRTHSNLGNDHVAHLHTMVEKYKVGGLIVFQGGPERQVNLLNQLQAKAKVPLLVASDAEWGLGMRLDSTMSFPYQMALGAVQDDALIKKMGAEIARQLRLTGVQMNMAPVIDINNNAKNPVISYRSFGENKQDVTKKGIAYMQGLQENGVVAVAKHFPGHGDTDTDSHYDLPLIAHDRARLDAIELYPFKKLIEAGVDGIMVAHLNIPALDTVQKRPSTLSPPIVTDLLKLELGFKGLVLTDAMDMKGVTKYHDPGVSDALAFLAGNDIMENTEDIPRAIEEMRKLILNGQVSEADLEERCRKVLQAKYWLGLSRQNILSTSELAEQLHTPQARLLQQQLAEAALTVLENKDDILPLKNLQNHKIASLSIGRTEETKFQQTLALYTDIEHFQLPKDATAEEIKQLKDRLSSSSLVIIALHQINRRPGNYGGFNEEVLNLASELATSGKAVFSVFRNAYTLTQIPEIEKAQAVLMAYQDDDVFEHSAAQLIFGAIGANGRLPVSVNEQFAYGKGIDIKALGRLKYTLPEEVGISSQPFEMRIDSIMQEMISEKAAPGGVVLLAKDGKVFFHKAYGHHTYAAERSVKLNDIYDYASLTKITSALAGLMKLHGEGKFDLDAPFYTYWKPFKQKGKREITVREALAHYAKLQAWIPYWKNELKPDSTFKKSVLRNQPSNKFSIQLTENLFLNKNYRKKIYKYIKKTPLNEEKKYLYSGLTFYLYPQIIEDITGQDYSKYLYENFYAPLGATTIGYNPSQRFPLDRIVPTENDTFFRRTQLHGVVHDEGASMMNGVSANAGLFSTANDLAKLMQMYLNMGQYAGEQYIAETSLKEFTRCQYCHEGNHRGAGFDKVLLDRPERGTPSPEASQDSFGHSGYTGTFAWADPENNLLYIFFSNRVHTTRENTKLYQLNIRTRIHQVAYDALKKNY